MIATGLQDDIDAALAGAAERFGRDYYALSERSRQSVAQRRFNAARWQAMAEMGWLAVATAEEDGGLGLRVGSMTALAEAAGRWGIHEPVISTGAIAADVLRLHASTAQRREWLPHLLQGGLKVACAFAWDAATVRVEGGHLQGRCEIVPDADIADLLLVQADAGGARRWFAVKAAARGLERQPHPLADGRGAASLRFTGCEAEPLPGDERAHPALLAALATAADALGSMEAAFALTLEHVKTRRQFNAPLGSHQVVAHRMVDMYLRLQESRATLAQAAAALAEDGEVGAGEVHAAKAFIGPQARLLAQEAVQLHGGIGITEECGASHCLRRALVDEQLHGTPAWHLQRFMERGGTA